MNALRQLAAKLGMQKIALMGAVAAALFGALAWISVAGGNASMAYLFSDLDPSAAQAIADKLKAENVPFQLSPDGTAIMAPEDRIPELRMAMAGDRLGGKIGYEVLDEQQPFGLSASREKLNETRAIEGELARSVQSLQNVSSARVHLVMPERAAFSNETRRARAAVTVKSLGRLPAEEVEAIRYLVASSVPELSPESVSVVDQTGALLARAGETGAAAGGDADERQRLIEAKMREQIESLLEPIAGQGKVRAEVSALIDRDQTREEESVVDPDKQAIAHQVTVESDDQSDQRDGASPAASVATQLPENQDKNVAGGDSQRSARKETSEDTTYENSRTNRVTVRVPGKINRLTVAVMIDPGAQKLPAAQVQRLQKLVENAVGFDSERGDSVVVEAMPFTAVALAEAEESIFSALPMDQIFSLLKVLIIAGVGLFAFRAVRPQIIDRRQTSAAAEPELLTAQPAPSALDQPENSDPDALRLAMANAESRGALLDQEIALADVEGRIKLSAIKRIGDTVATSPAEATAVIRQWMAS